MLFQSKKKLFGGLVSAILLCMLTIAALEVRADQTSGVTAESLQQSSFGELSGSPFLFDQNFTSPVITADKPFNVIGFKWSGGDNISFQVQTRQKNGWTDWQSMPAMEDIFGKGVTGTKVTDLLFVQPASQLRYRYEAVGEIEEIEIITLSSIENRGTFGFLSRWLGSLIPKATAKVNVITRADWGADEAITFWQPEYVQPEKFIIHHTAGSDGSDNPESTVRAIQYWHAVVMGWGDIGYNYLVDINGNVFEGRKGGDGVIAAHAYRASNCNEVRFGGGNEGVDFNRGSIGIALLGNFEDNNPSNKAVDAAARLIAEKAELFSINPTGTSQFRDLPDLPNIAGHIDVDCTLCPGENLYDELPELRTLSQNYLGESRLTYRAKFLKASVQSVKLAAGAAKKITADFKNTGSATWRTKDTPILITAAAPSSLKNDDWINSFRVTKPLAGSVAPGETASFEFYIKAPADQLELTETFQLAYKNLPLLNTDFQIRVEVTGLDWAARLDSNTINETTFLGASLLVKIAYINAGAQTWTKDTIRLKIYDLGDSASRYKDSSWPDDYGDIRLDQKSVAPGQTGTFSFTELSPINPGRYKQIFRLFYNQTEVINSEVSMINRVDSMYRARLVSTTLPLAVLQGWQPRVNLKFKNIGVATWDSNVRLEIYDLGNNLSRFYSSRWPARSGNIRLIENQVRPGEIGTFEFTMEAPRLTGLFKHIIRLNAQNYPYEIQGSQLVRLTRVD